MNLYSTTMWANVQRDGRPAEYRVAPCAQRRKVLIGLCPPLECRAVTLPIGERMTWRTHSEFCTWQNSVPGQQPPKMCIQSTSPGNGQTSCKVWLASGE